jgi:hypothetical protein
VHSISMLAKIGIRLHTWLIFSFIPHADTGCRSPAAYVQDTNEVSNDSKRSTPSHDKKILPRAQRANTLQRFSILSREKKTILRMLCIVGALWLCNLLAIVLFLYGSYFGFGYYTISYLYPWSTTFVFLNSLLNPFIFCYKNEHFRLRS